MVSVMLRRRYDVDAAHQLTAGVPEGHKCRRLHGHRYEVTLYVQGEPDENGVLIEYGDLDAVVNPMMARVDHHFLNTLSERCSTAEAFLVSENPTVERLAQWFGNALSGLIRSAKADGQRLRLVRVAVQETARSGADWEPSAYAGSD